MITKEELEATRIIADRKAEEIVKKGENMTNQDILDLCTLNKLRGKADSVLRRIKP